MKTDLAVTRSILIHSTPQKIWDALTHPAIIREYLYGAEVVSDWKPGSEIIFQGEYNGHPYRDKGNILEIIPRKILKYSYWSGFSGLEDKPENYSIVTYKLENQGHSIALVLNQQGFRDEAARNHTEENWTQVLEKIKEITENKS